jgi:hypothetical protein
VKTSRMLLQGRRQLFLVLDGGAFSNAIAGVLPTYIYIHIYASA